MRQGAGLPCWRCCVRGCSSPTAAAATLTAGPVPLARWWLIALGLTLLWDLAGADLAVMQFIGSPRGFALRDQWLLSRVLHDAVRQAAVLFYLLIWAWAAWPWVPVAVWGRWVGATPTRAR